MPFFKNKKIILRVFGALAFLGFALFLWAFVIEPNRLVVNEVAIPLPNFPKQLNGLKIVAISDIHGGSGFVSESKIKQLVELSNEQQPDLVVLLGDFVSQYSTKISPQKLKMEPNVIVKELAGLKAKYGVYAVMGNHDWWANSNRIRLPMEANGIKVIDNNVVEINANGQAFWLLGIPDYWTRQPIDLTFAMRKINKPAPIIAITHNPDIFPQVPSTVVLTIAGHTHGGQVNFPFIGAPIVPSAYGQRYAKGLVIENEKRLFITSGVGTTGIPVRFRVPPEIAVLTLSSGE